MPAIVEVSDGTTTVNLIDTAGFDIMQWEHGAPEQRRSLLSSELSEGDVLRSLSIGNARETMTLTLAGSSNDHVADQYQTLHKLLQQAWRYHVTDWQTGPVWIRARAGNETGARFSLISSGNVRPSGKSYLDPEFEAGDVWQDIELTVEREPFWRGTRPMTLPTAINLTVDDITQAASEIFVPNLAEKGKISYVYRRDAAPTETYSANLAAQTSFALFPDPPANGDELYIGSAASDGPFHTAVFFLGTLRGGGTGMVLEMGGSVWSSFGAANDGTNDLNGQGGSPGLYVLRLVRTNAWATSTVNAVNGWWLRYRITNATSMTTIPRQENQPIYAATRPWLNISSASIGGDADAIIRMLLNSKIAPQTARDTIMGFVAGLKSRGRENFNSYIDLAGQTGWTFDYFQAASEVDVIYPSGSKVACITTAGALQKRIVSYNNSAEVCKDFAGTYRVFIAARQNAGNRGDWAVRLRIATGGLDPTLDGAWRSETVKLTNTHNASQLMENMELVDMGTLTLPLIAGARGLVGTQASLLSRIDISVDASRTGSAASLVLSALRLIPIDEYVFSSEAPDLNADLQTGLQLDSMLVVDGGVMGAGAQLATSWLNPSYVDVNWLLTSPPPRLPPARNAELHFVFFGAGASAPSYHAATGAHLTLYPVERWSQLRGAD